MLLKELERTIPLAASTASLTSSPCSATGTARATTPALPPRIAGLSKIKPLAEEHGVTVCVELLNSKVDHKDYQGDHTAFGVEVMQAASARRG